MDRFEGDTTTTVQRQVLATVEFGALVTSIAAADQGQVTTGPDFAADVFDVGEFVMLGLFTTPTAFLRHVEQRVVAVLRGQQLLVATGNQVGFVSIAITAHPSTIGF